MVYATASGGGMEYCGATMSSMRALGHELFHSYFARGVMPANGNAGWIDEAMAVFRDRGYPSASEPPSGSSVNLGGYSLYRRTTTYSAYTLGADLIGHMNHLFSSREGIPENSLYV